MKELAAGTDALVDSIYAALLGEGDWQTFLNSLKGILPNGKGILFYHDIRAGIGGFPLSAGMDDEYINLYGRHYSRLNPWMKAAHSRPIGLGVPAKAMLPHSELLRTEFYNDFLKPQGVETAVGVTIGREAQCNFLLSVTGRDPGDHALLRAAETLTQIAHHLKRAFGFYRRSVGGGAALLGGRPLADALRIGVVSLGFHGRVKEMNPFAQKLLDSGEGVWIDRAGRLRCASTVIMRVLDAALCVWASGAGKTRMTTSLVPRGQDRLPLRVTFFHPSRSAAETYFAGPEALLILEDPEANQGPAIDLIGHHFKLTPRERDVVAGIAAGRTLADIASADGLTIGTVRTQLKQAFAKTGVQRQADLVRLVHLLGATAVNDADD